MEPEWIETEFPGYFVNRLGQVKGRHGKILRTWPATGGYLMIAISMYPEKPKRVKVHKLVAKTFLGEPVGDRTHVAHRNGINTDNRPENLRWSTPKENAADKILHGTNIGFSSPGEANPKAKLNEETVKQILRDEGTLTALAKKIQY